VFSSDIGFSGAERIGLSPRNPQQTGPVMLSELMLVQFPHPGSEHEPRGPVMDWNRHAHARKFLKATGRYIADGAMRSGSLAFWGEWEPQSRVVETFPAADAQPRWLHEPFWQRPSHRALLQNTDPLVFGDHFLYSNCRQLRNGKLRRLAPGSIVLFGSKLGGRFVLDTVLVVGDGSELFTRASAGSLGYDDWVQAVVFEPLSPPAGPPDDVFQLYAGRMHNDAPDGPFSFVPCRPYSPASATFARPAVDLDRRWINPNLAMGAKATLATQAQLRTIWHTIVDQVVDVAGLALGIELDPPRQLVEG
jgi:hypothetical protein